MSEWKTIEKYKGGTALFYFEAVTGSRHSSNDKAATVELTRHFGNRVCTKFLPFTMPEADA